MYPTQTGPRACWHNNLSPAGPGYDLPSELRDAAVAWSRALLGPGSAEVPPGSEAFHERVAVLFSAPPERWAYTLLHLAEYNGDRMSGLVAPGMSTFDTNDGADGKFAHDTGVSQEVILHQMFWAIAGVPVSVPGACTAAPGPSPPSGELPALLPRTSVLAGRRADDLAALVESLEAVPQLDEADEDSRSCVGCSLSC